MLDVDMSFGGNGSDLNMDSRMSMDARSRSSRVSDIEVLFFFLGGGAPLAVTIIATV